MLWVYLLDCFSFQMLAVEAMPFAGVHLVEDGPVGSGCQLRLLVCAEASDVISPFVRGSKHKKYRRFRLYNLAKKAASRKRKEPRSALRLLELI
jgi:hypothetical protein